ncbi:mucin-associated surface protein (MASP), putative, partial [Trypanosoma cruzi]
MMTMTGRVLLVCALCVLWCGACGGGRAETSPVSPGTPPEKKPQEEEEPVGGAGGGVKNGEQKVTQAAAPKGSELQELSPGPSQATQPGGASVTSSTTTDSKDQNAQEDKKEGEDEQEEGEEEELEEEEEEKKIQQENEEREEESRGEEKSNEKKEEEVKKHEEAVTGTTNEMSTGSQKQPSLSSGTEGASNITNPKSTQTTGDDDPAADGAGTREGKQNENKD